MKILESIELDIILNDFASRNTYRYDYLEG
jgi:hypothetical protein